jgi:hypothetical protein
LFTEFFKFSRRKSYFSINQIITSFTQCFFVITIFRGTFASLKPQYTMKKLFTLIGMLSAFTSLSMAQPTAWTNCGGTVNTRTWNGLGTDNLWTNGDNWSGGVAPDCNDDVVFDRSVSNKDCEITSNVVCRDITMGATGPGAGYTGRLLVNGSNTFSARNITMFGGYIQVDSGLVKIDVLDARQNAYFGAVDFQAHDAVNVQGGSTMRFGIDGVVDFGGTLTIGRLGAVFAPSYRMDESKGVINFHASLTKHKVSSFHHRLGIARFIGNTPGASTIDLSPSTDTRGSITFNVLEINLPSGAALQTDNLVFGSGALGEEDTVNVVRRMTLIDGDIKRAAGNGGLWNIHDTLQLNGKGDESIVDASIRFAGEGTADYFINESYSGNNGNDINQIYVDMSGSGNVNVTAGSASYVSSSSWFFENGTANFDNSKDLTVSYRITHTGGTVNLPSSSTLTFQGDQLHLHGGTWNAGNGKFVFARTAGNVSIDFNTEKSFYDLEINMPGTTAAAPRSIITTGNPGNDNLLVTNDFNFVEGAWRGDGNDLISIEGDATFGTSLDNNAGSVNLNDNSFRFVGTSNSTLNANGIPQGSTYDIIVEKNAANKVIVTTTQAVTEILDGGRLVVKEGSIEFDGNTDVKINTNDQPGIVVEAGGVIVAPANKTFELNGSWEIADVSCFVHNGGTVLIATPTASLNGFNQNGGPINLNNLTITKNSGALDWNVAGDSLIINGNFDVTNNGIVRYASINLKGNYHSNSGSAFSIDLIDFTGNTVQNIDISTKSEFRTAYVRINGAGVKLLSEVQLGQINGRLDLSTGNLDQNGQALELVNTGSSWRLIGGSSSSYIFGGAFKVSGGGIGNSPGKVLPIGSSTNYRPVTIRSSSAVFTAQYFEANYGDNDVTAPLDAQNSANAYWTITGNGNHQVELSTSGGPSYSDMVVARFNSTSGSWETRGGSVAGGFVSTTSQSASGTFDYTLGQDPPAPISLSTKEVVSGQELNTQNTNSTNSAVASAVANVAFNVYPNPVNDVLNVRVINANKGVVVLSDIQGKVYGTFNAEVKSINFSAMSAGVYMVTFTDGVNKIAHRVVKN